MVIKEDYKMENKRKNFISYYYETLKDLPEVTLDPKTTALLIVDMQNEFILRDFGEALQFKAAGEWERWFLFMTD